MAHYRQEVDQYGPLSAARLARVARVQQHAIPLERYEFFNGGSIDFIPCGQQDPVCGVRCETNWGTERSWRNGPLGYL